MKTFTSISIIGWPIICVICGLFLISITAPPTISVLKPPPPLRPGEKVPTFQLNLIYPSRESTTIPSPGNQLCMILIYSPHCPTCKSIWPTWQSLSSRLPSRSTIALSTLSEPETITHAKNKHLPFPVGLFPDTQPTAAYRLYRVPTTILLKGNRVLGSWPGPLSRTSIREIQALIRFHSLAESSSLKNRKGFKDWVFSRTSASRNLFTS